MPASGPRLRSQAPLPPLPSHARLAGAGIGLGVVFALATAGFLNAVLYGVAPHDPLTFTVLPLGLGLVALLASWIPAWRAARVDPREALSAE